MCVVYERNLMLASSTLWFFFEISALFLSFTTRTWKWRTLILGNSWIFSRRKGMRPFYNNSIKEANHLFHNTFALHFSSNHFPHASWDFLSHKNFHYAKYCSLPFTRKVDKSFSICSAAVGGERESFCCLRDARLFTLKFNSPDRGKLIKPTWKRPQLQLQSDSNWTIWIRFQLIALIPTSVCMFWLTLIKVDLYSVGGWIERKGLLRWLFWWKTLKLRYKGKCLKRKYHRF